MKVSIWGKELNAWVAAAALSKVGNHVTLESLTPEDQKKNLTVRNEPGLLELLKDQQSSGKINFSSESLPTESSVHWLAFGADEFEAAEILIHKLAISIPSNLLIINQSYFNIGSTEQLDNYLNSKTGQFIAYLPSALSEGSALRDFTNPDSCIIGSDYRKPFSQIRALLRPFLSRITSIQLMTAREAEFTKFAINGMLALRLGYINEMANLADSTGVDIEPVKEAMSCDQRIGPHYLSPGCGFGGNAFSSHIKGLIETFKHKQLPSLLNTLLDENERQKEIPFKKLWQHYNCNLKGRVITIWGASFKPLSASISHAPSIKIIDALIARGCYVNIHDPAALENLCTHYQEEKNLRIFEDMYSALKNSDGLIVTTAWSDYMSPDYCEIKKHMKTPLIIDGRNIYEKNYLKDTGFIYHGIGR